MAGRCTLTATSAPPYLGVRRAWWTCAIEAAPSGASSNHANTSSNVSSPVSSSCAITRRTSDAGIGSR